MKKLTSASGAMAQDRNTLRQDSSEFCRLLPRSINRSLRSLNYLEKREKYLTQNMLAQTPHPSAYANNPALKRVITDLGFESLLSDPKRPFDIVQKSRFLRQHRCCVPTQTVPQHRQGCKHEKQVQCHCHSDSHHPQKRRLQAEKVVISCMPWLQAVVLSPHGILHAWRLDHCVRPE